MEETQLKNSVYVMEGGGMRGLYTAGVIDVLMENEIYAEQCSGRIGRSCFWIAIISPGRSEEFFAIIKKVLQG